ncbi:aftiphilin isoform X1 [Ixodes scapularis]
MSHPEAPAGPDSHATEARDDDASWDNLEFEADWQQAACGNDDDDFTDFAQATSSELPADDGFADFAAFESAPKEEEEDESWTAFEATTEVTLGHLGGYQQEQSSPEQLLRLAYPGGETGESEVDLDPTSLHTKLWLILQDLDQATSLQYQWSSSGCCQHLLHSLNIDSRNILRNPSVPLFACHLGLLEPQRGPADEALESPAPEDCIPPAQFDWTSSGLVNPLEQPSSSSLLDLDFLTALSSSSARTDATSTGPVTNGLEEELVCPPEGVPSVRGACRLQQLLASNVPTLAPSLQPRSKPPLLSGDAQRLLDSLPDLTFMQAAVLMFPVRLDS